MRLEQANPELHVNTSRLQHHIEGNGRIMRLPATHQVARMQSS